MFRLALREDSSLAFDLLTDNKDSHERRPFPIPSFLLRLTVVLKLSDLALSLL